MHDTTLALSQALSKFLCSLLAHQCSMSIQCCDKVCTQQEAGHGQPASVYNSNNPQFAARLQLATCPNRLCVQMNWQSWNEICASCAHNGNNLTSYHCTGNMCFALSLQIYHRITVVPSTELHPEVHHEDATKSTVLRIRERT